MRAEMIQCLKTIKKSEFIQNDYKELTDLALIVLGEPNKKYSFKSPVGLSNARRIALRRYALKCYIFQKELNLVALQKPQILIKLGSS